MSAIQISERI